MQYTSQVCRSLLLITISAVFTFSSLETHAQATDQENVMLVLGSANIKTLRHRVDVASRLYHSDIDFERIIVSGGCGAHSSSICEASKMDSLLAVKGVPAQKIFKEEKSRSTKQNYCYSRKLRADGVPLITTASHLYVVSDHWHAISVASCFRQADGLNNSTFHIEGDIVPRGPVDYTNIFEQCRENNFCRTMLWAFVDAAYFDATDNKVYYFVDGIYYRETPGKGVDPGFPKKITRYPAWPPQWDPHLDAAYFDPNDHSVYLFHGDEVSSHISGKKAAPGRTQKISRYMKNWPEGWGRGYIDAAYYDQNSHGLILFKNSEYISYPNGSDHPKISRIKTHYPADWPFQWGTGDVDAAYQMVNTETFLYRGTDYLELTSGGTIPSEYPKAISLPWPEDLWGERFKAR